MLAPTHSTTRQAVSDSAAAVPRDRVLHMVETQAQPRGHCRRKSRAHPSQTMVLAVPRFRLSHCQAGP